ncbi:HIT domain-containing protein [Candidatus Deianiraea vastatrix]|uniref:Nucleotide binding HIT-like protein n=1 Tax=Candidatus Deianiraea vastatrix TaxID=2163644 RepID=A0A5B8XEY7_9RICK|nr:HIT domain-containing protein [Candidatus Deianiraea vastatrix]QED23852.1 Putative nucleotide binding HIT-like protein [Candidatus Deianiraea vastatrix]
MYDNNNPFAKILRGELGCKKVWEDDKNLAFWSIEPKAPVHILVIPKKNYVDFDDFSQNASSDEISSTMQAISKVAKIMNLEDGYRVVTNNGKNSGQSVFHLHFHILGKAVLSDDIKGL